MELFIQECFNGSTDVQNVLRTLSTDTTAWLKLIKLTQAMNISSVEKSVPITRSVYYRSDMFEIMILRWKANAYRSTHSHPENGCLMMVYEGVVQETRYNKHNAIIKQKVLEKFDIQYIDDSIGLHDIFALTDAITIHIYSPPLFYDLNISTV